MVQQGIALTQLSEPLSYDVPREWILLDSQSTISLFNNDRLLHNIRAADDIMYVFTNGGSTAPQRRLVHAQPA